MRGDVASYSTTPSYQYLHKGVMEAFVAVELPAKQFCLHSLRAGGATLAANVGIPGWTMAGEPQWQSQRSAFGYVKTSAEANASVTTAMFPSR